MSEFEYMRKLTRHASPNGIYRFLSNVKGYGKSRSRALVKEFAELKGYKDSCYKGHASEISRNDFKEFKKFIEIKDSK